MYYCTTVSCAKASSKINYFPVKSFEKAMEELRDIIDKLESGSLSLEESIKLFQKGTKLIGYSHKKLNEIEKKVEILIKDSEDDLKLEDFEPEED